MNASGGLICQMISISFEGLSPSVFNIFFNEYENHEIYIYGYR